MDNDVSIDMAELWIDSVENWTSVNNNNTKRLVRRGTR